jgi:mutator protein MutT
VNRPTAATAGASAASPSPGGVRIVDRAALHRLLKCDAALRELIGARLAAWPLQPIADSRRTHAAVAVAITEEGPGAGLPSLPRHGGWSEQAALILTRRAGGLRRHASQWAMPGGRIDAGETPEQAALRELVEEVGLELAPGAVLGRLDDFETRSGYLITPVVVWAGAARELKAAPAEVSSIHRIPLAEFLRPDAPILEHLPDAVHPVLRMPVGDQWIAAPTGAIIYQFCEVCIAGRATRVAHYDQPLFAWK